MNELVDLYDTAIKTMKASQEIKSDIEKTQKFKEMLGPYFKLFKGWASGTVGANGYLNMKIGRLIFILIKLKKFLEGCQTMTQCKCSLRVHLGKCCSTWGKDRFSAPLS